MAFESTIAAIPSYSTGLAILVFLDAAVWGYALHLLPTSRKSAVLRLLSWCWAVIPVAVLLVIGYRASLMNRAKLHSWWFGDATYTDEVQQSLLAGPDWNVPSWLFDYGVWYFFASFVLLATLSIIAVPRERLPNGFGPFMAILPMALAIYHLVTAGF